MRKKNFVIKQKYITTSETFVTNYNDYLQISIFDKHIIIDIEDGVDAVSMRFNKQSLNDFIKTLKGFEKQLPN